MKQIIAAIAILLFIATASPASANQPDALGLVTAYTVSVGSPTQMLPVPTLAGHNLEIPLLGLAVSGLLFGLGRVWGK